MYHLFHLKIPLMTTSWLLLANLLLFICINSTLFVLDIKSVWISHKKILDILHIWLCKLKIFFSSLTVRHILHTNIIVNFMLMSDDTISIFSRADRCCLFRRKMVTTNKSGSTQAWLIRTFCKRLCRRSFRRWSFVRKIHGTNLQKVLKNVYEKFFGLCLLIY